MIYEGRCLKTNKKVAIKIVSNSLIQIFQY